MNADFQRLISQLENMILSGGFQPHERLPEQQLSDEFGVSRFWIRDAFKVLESRGLIELIPYKGAVVYDISEREIEEIFEIRDVLEALATQKAAVNAKPADIKKLERVAVKFEQSTQQNDFGRMISANEDFHNCIYEMSRNQTLVETIKQFQARCHIVRFHSWSSPGHYNRLIEDHRLLIAGIKNKDFKSLAELAAQHISYSKKSYLWQLRTRRTKTTGKKNKR